jgi:arylsulfatase A-like enzyme
VDAAIGKILDKIEQLKIGDNTYVILMAYNGSVEFFQPVKNKCIIASIIASIGVAIFMITLVLDYKNVFG